MVDIRASSHPHENVGVPGAPFLYGVSLLHCMTVSLAQERRRSGRGVGRADRRPDAPRGRLRPVEVKRLDGDFVNNYYVARRQDRG